MRILLDENISELAREYLIVLGYDCSSIKSLGYSNKGYSDEDVLQLAIETQSLLITHNGKDFIYSIPPRVDIRHFGLVWLRENLTRKNCVDYIDFICQEIFDKEEDFINTVWQVKFKLTNKLVKKTFPKNKHC